MKKICAFLLALSLLIALATPVYAETPISGAYVYYEDGMPKYWLDFTGSVADNVVLTVIAVTDIEGTVGILVVEIVQPCCLPFRRTV